MITLDRTRFGLDDLLDAHRRGLASSVEAVDAARAEGQRLGVQLGIEQAKRRVEALLDSLDDSDRVRRAGVRMALERLSVTVADVDPVQRAVCSHPTTKNRQCFVWCTVCGAALRPIRSLRKGDLG